MHFHAQFKPRREHVILKPLKRNGNYIYQLSVAFSPQANYTDGATATCRRI
jgi:hypothetical protein